MSDTKTPVYFNPTQRLQILERVEADIKTLGPTTIEYVAGWVVGDIHGIAAEGRKQVAQWAIARLLSEGRIRLYDRADVRCPAFVSNSTNDID